MMTGNNLIAIDMAGNKRVFARGASKTWKDADYDAVKIK